MIFNSRFSAVYTVKEKKPRKGIYLLLLFIEQGYKGIIVSGKRIISDCQTDYNGKDASADGL
jgi:hypothetical protein